MEASTRTRVGNWIETYTGLQFWPLDPRPEDICIEDIAHSLANQCRFAGHVSRFYSVAQHCHLASQLVPPEDALWALLHDATEAYLVDLPRPIKSDEEFGVIYREAEERVMLAICTKFGLSAAMPASVKYADNLLVVNEARTLMFSAGRSWSWGHDMPFLPHGLSIHPLSPETAEELYLTRFIYLSNGVWVA